MNRVSEFKAQTQHKLITIRDSRFGLRKLFMNQQERPSIKTYKNPGRGWHGYN